MHTRLHPLFCLLLIPLLSPVLSWGQQQSADTMHLSVAQAETVFLQRNLSLLANKYNVDINKALVQQARVWDNPVLSTDQSLYDGKFFRYKTVDGIPYGQVFVQVEQLIRTAGKIKKETRLAQDNVLSAEAQFNDLMRNLKFALSTDLNNLAQLQNMAAVFLNEMITMRQLAKGMDEMLKLGDVSQKENVRIKALLFSLESDHSDNLHQQYDLQKDIAEMLQLNDNVWVVADSDLTLTPEQVTALSLTALQDSALAARPDLAFAKTQLQYQQHNISYQQALAKPDVTVGVSYDRLSSYTNNYYGLGFSVPLPLFNRNKGNIEAAKLAGKQSEAIVMQAQVQVNKEVLSAWQKLANSTSMLNSENAQLKDSYDVLMKNMLNSYRQRQVNLVEFIDFMDAYKETRIKQGQLVTSQRNAAAELNYSMNLNLIKL